jgi:chromosome segregation ATPase
MVEVFKEHLEKYLIKLIKNIGDKSLINEIQEEYESLMDEFIKHNFIPQEQIDSIVDQELGESEKQLKKITKEKEELSKSNQELNEQIKILNLQKENFNQKLNFLQKSIISSERFKVEKEKKEEELKNLKSDYDILKGKYDMIKDEMEIYKKNLKKNFNMEKEIRQLTEENEKLSQKIKDLNEKDDYKIQFYELEKKYNTLSNEKEDLLLERNQLKNDNSELNEQIETRNQQINNLENNIKLNKHLIEEKTKENEGLIKEKNVFGLKLKEIEFNAKNNKTLYENQNKEIKKELSKLYKEHEELKLENKKMSEQIKNYQNYTGLAKASKENLSKKDFSMLETMSRRVEEGENLINDLKNLAEGLEQENKNLKEKKEIMENLIFYYMKLNGESIENLNIKNIQFNENDYQEIMDLKVDSETLIKMLFKTKQENLKLLQNIQELTSEYNQRLRDLSLKK